MSITFSIGDDDGRMCYIIDALRRRRLISATDRPTDLFSLSPNVLYLTNVMSLFLVVFFLCVFMD